MVNAEIPSVAQVDFDGMPAWEITSRSGAKALVAERGATLISWEPRPGKNVIAGYVDAEELRNCVASRSRIMAPWAGRVGGHSYSFEGEEFDVSHVHEGGMHGLMSDVDFDVANAGETLTLTHRFEPRDIYPWEFVISVTFSLIEGGTGEENLVVSIDAHNTNEESIPLSLGWHPYIQFPGSSISNVSMSIPARTRILLDANRVPLAGEAGYAGVKAPFTVDYLGSTQLDASFRGLIPNEDGVVVSTFRDQVTNQQIELVQEPGEAPVVHIFTGDGLPRDPRKSIAVEPLSHLADAFNRPDAQGSIRLEPGASRSMTATLTYRG